MRRRPLRTRLRTTLRTSEARRAWKECSSVDERIIARRTREARRSTRNRGSICERLLGQGSQLDQQAVHLFCRVVMRKANTQHAAALLHTQPLREIDRVVVAVPGEDAALAQVLGQLTWRVALHSNGHCRSALIELCRILDAVER